MFDTLLIAASFFGYAGEIKRELENRGRRVLWFEDRPAIDAVSKALLRVAPWLIKEKVTAHCTRIVNEARQHNILDVLIIKGEAIGPEVIRSLRRALPNAKFTLYFWDSYRNMPSKSRDKVGLCNRAFTFDPEDARADPRLSYRPLFFLPEYASLPAGSQDIDVLFVGTAHTDRYSVVKRLARSMPPELRFERVWFMPSKALYCVLRTFSPGYWVSSSSDFIFEPLQKSEVLRLIRRAGIVVDIERPVQTGFTMRSIEMLGASRKLITTNPMIRSADFYHPSNQFFIDRKSPTVAESFLYAKWSDEMASVVPRYSLGGWVSEVVGD